jgi:hypothetical protein
MPSRGVAVTGRILDGELYVDPHELAEGLQAVVGREHGTDSLP